MGDHPSWSLKYRSLSQGQSSAHVHPISQYTGNLINLHHIPLPMHGNKLPSFPSSNDSDPAICPSKSFLAFCRSLLTAYTPENRAPSSDLELKVNILVIFETKNFVEEFWDS